MNEVATNEINLYQGNYQKVEVRLENLHLTAYDVFLADVGNSPGRAL